MMLLDGTLHWGLEILRLRKKTSSVLLGTVDCTKLGVSAQKEPPVCTSRTTLSEQGAWLYPANTLDLLDFSVYARPELFRET